MHVVIDALPSRVGGGITYLNNILPELCKVDPHIQYTVIKQAHVELVVAPAANMRMVDLKVPFSSVAARVAFQQFWLPLLLRRWKADVLYSPHDTATLATHIPTILAIRNSNIFTNDSVGGSLSEHIRFGILRRLSLASVRRAAKVIFVSNASKDWISANWGEKIRAKTVVIPHGFVAGTTPAPAPPVALTQPYLLAVSTVYRHKNLEPVIKAMADIVAEGFPHHFYIAGGRIEKAYAADLDDLIVDLGLTDRIHFLGNVRQPQLDYLYKSATLFVFPSTLETFGHPLLEAQSSGAPVVASDMAVFREIGGDGALYLPATDAARWSETMRRLLRSEEDRDAMARAGKQNVKRYSWSVNARQLVNLFKEARADAAA